MGHADWVRDGQTELLDNPATPLNVH